MPEPLRWGILGTGRMARRVATAIREAGHQVVVVGSRDAAKAAGLGFERVGTYEEVVADPAVEVIYNALPNDLHAPWTIQAAEAGKHILCEKPLAATVEECEAMVAATRGAGVHLVEAFMYRYHPQWQVVWRAVQSGSLGQMRLLRAGFGFFHSNPADFRLLAAHGGGALQDVGCYCVNVARWFLGEPSRAWGVSADLRGVGVDTHNSAVLEFGPGAQALLDCSFDTHMHQKVEIVGERGRVEVPVAFVTSGETRVRIVDADGDRTETVAAADSYVLEVQAVERLIRHDEPILTPGADAIPTQRILAAWQRATVEGVVTLSVEVD